MDRAHHAESSFGSSIRSPEWFVAMAGTSVAASIVLFALGAGLGSNLAGYVLASILPFTLVAVARRDFAKRLVTAGVSERRGVRGACVAILALGLISVIVHAYLIAHHFA